jgi:diguanylate cyclase (GGDEF)-like protein
MVCALLIAVLLSVTVTRHGAALISRFTRAAQRVRNGDLEFQVPVSGSSDVGEFAESFNQMIAGLKESRDRILEGNSRDSLTGLYNHMYLHERLGSEIRRAERYEHELSVLMIDLDRFKFINDTFGHPVGDSIVQQLAAVLRSSLREIDVPIRYGGDEFAAILLETGEESALCTAERIRAAIEEYEFRAIPISQVATDTAEHDPSTVIHATVTIGVACYPAHHLSKDGIIMSADIALCRAKHVCRNSVGLYESAGADGNIDPDKLYQVLHDPNGAAVASLAAAVDARDHYTSGHSERVAGYAQQIAQAAMADQEIIDAVKTAGMLHDIGKIGVADAVLNKAGSLTNDEREQINQHPSLGANILKRAPQLDQIIPAVIFHHERWDGAGYPNGLVGEQIPFIARIMAIADAFDAMTSDRPYRKAMPVEAALIELQAGVRKQFDPDLVEAFLQHMTQLTEKAA